MAPLWHVNPTPLVAGSVVEPGWWGKQVLSRGAIKSDRPTGSEHYYRELLFEYARRIVAPAAPSRLACTYAYDDVVTAGAHIAATQLRAFPVDPEAGAVTSRHDIRWIDFLGQPGVPPDRTLEMAAAYWRGDRYDDPALAGYEAWEVLVGGRLVVRG